MRFGRTGPLPNQSKWDSAETEYSVNFFKGSAEYSAETQNTRYATYIISISLCQIDSIILIYPTEGDYSQFPTQLKSQTKEKVYKM